MVRELVAGDVLLITFPVHVPGGHEQEGQRPAVVVAVPPSPLRFPVVIVAPLTSQAGPWADQNPALYPGLPLGSGGLTRNSIALLDQIRAVDVHLLAGWAH